MPSKTIIRLNAAHNSLAQQVLDDLEALEKVVRVDDESEGHVRSNILQTISSDNITLTRPLKESLTKFFSGRMPVLYTTYASLAIALAGSFSSYVVITYVMSSPTRNHWQDVLDWGVLEGLLAYLGTPIADQRAIAKYCYAPFCQLLDVKKIPSTTTLLRRQICNLLTDSATNQPGNKAALVSDDHLGCARIAEMVCSAREYAALDGIMELLVRLLPGTRNRIRREDFTKNIFMASLCIQYFGANHCEALANLFIHQRSDWVETTLRAMKIMGQANMKHPQFLQTSSMKIIPRDMMKRSFEKHVWIDSTSIFLTFLEEDDKTTTLEININTVSRIRSNPKISDIVFTFSLSSPPLLAGAPLTVDANYEQVAISFQVARTNASRLLAILEDRGIGQIWKDESTGSDRQPRVSSANKAIALVSSGNTVKHAVAISDVQGRGSKSGVRNTPRPRKKDQLDQPSTPQALLQTLSERHDSAISANTPCSPQAPSVMPNAGINAQANLASAYIPDSKQDRYLAIARLHITTPALENTPPPGSPEPNMLIEELTKLSAPNTAGAHFAKARHNQAPLALSEQPRHNEASQGLNMQITPSPPINAYTFSPQRKSLPSVSVSPILPHRAHNLATRLNVTAIDLNQQRHVSLLETRTAMDFPSLTRPFGPSTPKQPPVARASKEDSSTECIIDALSAIHEIVAMNLKSEFNSTKSGSNVARGLLVTEAASDINSMIVGSSNHLAQMGKHAGSIKSSMENITGKYGEISKKNKAIKKRLASMIRAHDNHIVKRNRNAIDSNNSGALVQSA